MAIRAAICTLTSEMAVYGTYDDIIKEICEQMAGGESELLLLTSDVVRKK